MATNTRSTTTKRRTTKKVATKKAATKKSSAKKSSAGNGARKAGSNGADADAEARAEAKAKANGEAAMAEKDKEIARLTNFKNNLSRQVGILAENLALSESIVRNIPEPMLVVGMDGIVSYANDALCELLGEFRKNIEGKQRERDVWKLGPDEMSILEECVRRREPIRAVKLQVSRNGKKIELVATATPRRTSTGEMKGAFAVYRDLVAEVRLTGDLLDATEGVTEVQTSVAEISTAAQEQVTTATQQKTTVAQVSTTAVELASASKQVAESCARIAEATGTLVRTARGGQELLAHVMSNLAKVQEMTKVAGDQIFGLSDRSKRVNSVVDLINSVAAETKLIAFNAAIEAARAGEAGRGFGVVATEVKSLAVSVSESGKEIKSLVGDILSSINRAVLTAEGQVKLVEEMGEIATASDAAFGEIVTGIEQVADRAAVISASTQQQRNATDQLAVSMEELSSAASHTASAAKQTMSAVAMLSDFAGKLAGALERFKQDND